jgi:hypothetical protein
LAETVKLEASSIIAATRRPTDLEDWLDMLCFAFRRDWSYTYCSNVTSRLSFAEGNVLSKPTHRHGVSPTASELRFALYASYRLRSLHRPHPTQPYRLYSLGPASLCTAHNPVGTGRSKPPPKHFSSTLVAPTSSSAPNRPK